MNTLNILHLSDFHFCIEPRRENIQILLARSKSEALRKFARRPSAPTFWQPASYDPDVADAVAMFCAENEADIDLILVTGDLATTGMMSDIAVARQYFLSPVLHGYFTANGQTGINRKNVPIFVLPGNHDRYRDNTASPGAKTFDFVFPKLAKQAHEAIDYLVFEVEGGRLYGIISCDHCLIQSKDADFPSRLNRYGQGRVYSERIDELRLVTQRTREKYNDIEILWISHFPVFPDVNRSIC